MDGTAGAVQGTPRLLLRAEGAALLLLALAGYAQFGAAWWVFAALVLAPDLSMLAYLAGQRAGATAYNAAHTTLGPLALLVAGALGLGPAAVALALIWLAHVGADRMLGYGLKYAGGFGQTHLGIIGRR